MDNKELPKEIMNEIKGLAKRETDLGYYDGSELPAFADGLGKGAQIAQSHYEPIIQSKDTTIKELQAKNEKLTGLLKDLCYAVVENGWDDEEVTYYILSHRKHMTKQEAQESYYQDFKEQHGI